jgi:hypothetical protein
VKWFNKCVAFALLALWLPVTQHCDLEAAGVLAAHADANTHAAENGCCEPSEPCAHDGCELVENGIYHASGSLLKTVTPALLVFTCFLSPQLAAPDPRVEPALPVVADVKPQGWVPTWHFVRRAAPLSRAPSLLG